MRRSPRRHDTGGRVVETSEPIGPGKRFWIPVLVVLAGLILGLRLIATGGEPADRISFITDKLVVVGVEGFTELTAGDRALIGDRLDRVEIGSVAIRPRYVGDCAAAGWTTLGAGRRAAVGGHCTVQVRDGRVVDWQARLDAAAARQGDARLGNLADSVEGCVAAVGPGASLAAADPDGTLAAYQTVDEFVANRYRTPCPITLVDGGSDPSALIAALSADEDVTLIVTGIGPRAGSDDPSLQVIYRLGTTFSGWLTSASTRRTGIVTLTDLTRTLIDFGTQESGTPAGVDGSPLALSEALLTMPDVVTGLAEVRALSIVAPQGYVFLGVVGAPVVAGIVIAAVRRRWRLARALTLLPATLPLVMILVGSIGWQSAGRPLTALIVGLVGWWAAVIGTSIGLGRLLKVPSVIATAGLTVLACTCDAALGGPMQPGSLLNSRPVFGLRWYGFGNVTFAVYAAAGLLLAGYLAGRLGAGRPSRPTTGAGEATARKPLATAAVAVIGFGIVAAEGWPSMGSDFGGVVALTPAVLWLLFATAGVRLSWLRLVVVGGAAVAAVTAISVLDWRRGPDHRSHLGNFVQRVLDGDALDVVSRKAVASAETVISPLGLAALVVGFGLWALMLRRFLPGLALAYPVLRPAALAVLIVAILGTLVNDGGISVWLTATGIATFAVTWLWLDSQTGH